MLLVANDPDKFISDYSEMVRSFCVRLARLPTLVLPFLSQTPQALLTHTFRSQCIAV